MVKNPKTALSWGTTVPSDIYLPFSCRQQNSAINDAFDQRFQQVTLPPINIQQNNCVSTRWWSGAMLHDHRLFLNSKDDRGALCQVRSPKEDKETFDDSSFIVAPYKFYKCDNKEKQKSQFRIGSTGRLAFPTRRLATREEDIYEEALEEIFDEPKSLLLPATPDVMNTKRLFYNSFPNSLNCQDNGSKTFSGTILTLLPIASIYATDTTQLSRQFYSSSDYPSIPLETTFSMDFITYKFMKINRQCLINSQYGMDSTFSSIIFNFGRANELNTSKISNLMPTTYYYHFNEKFSFYSLGTMFQVITIAERISGTIYLCLLDSQNGNNFAASLYLLNCFNGIEIYVPINLSSVRIIWTTVHYNFSTIRNFFRMLYNFLLMPQLSNNDSRKCRLHTNDYILHTNDYFISTHDYSILTNDYLLHTTDDLPRPGEEFLYLRKDISKDDDRRTGPLFRSEDKFWFNDSLLAKFSQFMPHIVMTQRIPCR